MHPLFADCFALSPHLELRTSWALYAQEFSASVRCYPRYTVVMDPVPTDSMATHFEVKYQRAGMSLWRVTVTDTLTVHS